MIYAQIREEIRCRYCKANNERDPECLLWIWF